MGAQDSLEYANEFVASTRTGGGQITMIWDQSFESWRHFGIRSQPYWILYDAEGNLVSSSPGSVNTNLVADAIS